ncbi:LOW QUALITY PROTEIN: hypothetical protein CVT25_007973 [Psilocybe cyanescens]|uniref:CxC1-like cysteine cluster associated with KDZ transposases domain-containing protein n=1 Tax=Psilocybe cyanescens TaxID=93625 RepID=A0A409XN22_PSICY|nr:LOW QUALITY PROTEIN: hypothetical protein CVT25_007973 [Psilocybe cyanescens]
MSSKRHCLSSGVTIVCGTSFGIQQQLEGTQKHVRLNKSAKELAAEKAQYQVQLAKCEDLICTTENDIDMANEWIDEEDAAFSRPPPGDEGFFSSHAGGEVQLQDVFLDTLAKQCKMQGSSDMQGSSRTSGAGLEILAVPPCQSISPISIVRGPEDGNQVPWSIEIISLEGHSKSAAVTLVESGVILASPEQPQLGFTIESLQFYRQLRCVFPRFSLNAFAKTLNFYHTIPHMPYLANQLSNAYDCYLQIIWAVEKLVRGELKHGDTWDTQNFCPPCLYEVEDKVPLKFRFLAAMDGNNSLKLIDSVFHAGLVCTDTCISTSECWIPPEEVDVFKDEVKKAHLYTSGNLKQAKQLTHLQAQCQKVLPQIATDLKILIVNKLPGSMFWNTMNWLNAPTHASTIRRMQIQKPARRWIFLTVCCHGHVLVIMKYPLAIVNQLFQDFGSDICLAYDIMCAFVTTLKNSNLGSKMVALNLSGIMPIRWHPVYIDGMGMEYFEECECTLACSNELASVTRLSTPYHQQQHIDKHFHFHDFDKHAASGNSIYKNYCQALERIAIDTPHLVELSTKLNVGAADYKGYLKSEREYLAGLCTEPAEEQMKAEYVELLFNLDLLRSVEYFSSIISFLTIDIQKSDAAKARFNNCNHLMIEEGYTGKQITQITTQYCTTFQCWTAKNKKVLRYEDKHNIPIQWTPTMQEYEEAFVILCEQKYCRALDNLERLVVQHLFKMKKLGMSGVGYKLCEKIGKSLKTRAGAIQSALKRYNEVAAVMVPPRTVLTWEMVIAAINLANFDLLQDTQQDIRTLEWVQPANREGMIMYFQIKQAKEELVCLNMEIQQLLTFLYDDHVNHYHAICANLNVNPPLAFEISA